MDLLAETLPRFPFTWGCLAIWLAVNVFLVLRGRRSATRTPGWHTDVGTLRLLLCIWGLEAILRLIGLLDAVETVGPPRSRGSLLLERAQEFSAALAVAVAVLAVWLLGGWLTRAGRLTASPLTWLSCLVVPLLVLVDWIYLLFLVGRLSAVR